MSDNGGLKSHLTSRMWHSIPVWHSLWCVLKDPSFHVSLAWCVGDSTGQLNECIEELQVLQRLSTSVHRFLEVLTVMLTGQTAWCNSSLDWIYQLVLLMSLIELLECGWQLWGRAISSAARLRGAALQDWKQDLPLSFETLRKLKTFVCQVVNKGDIVWCHITTKTIKAK